MHLVLNFELETESQGSSSLMRIRGDLDLQVVDQVTEAFTRVEIVRPPAGVRQAFDRTRLDEVITISDDLAAIYP